MTTIVQRACDRCGTKSEAKSHESPEDWLQLRSLRKLKPTGLIGFVDVDLCPACELLFWRLVNGAELVEKSTDPAPDTNRSPDASRVDAPAVGGPTP